MIELIRGSLTYLRPIEADDLELISVWENNPEFWEISEHSGPLTSELLKAFIEGSSDMIRDGQIRYIIHDHDSNAIGALDIFDYDSHLKSGGIGILIAESEDRRKGFANDALHSFLAHQKITRELLLIRSLIHVSNNASIALFLKNGFRKMGTKYYKGREAIQFVWEN